MNLFRDYLGAYVENYQLSCLGGGEILRFAVKKEDRELLVVLKLAELVPYCEIVNAENSIKEKMGLKKVLIKPRYMSELFETAYFSSIIDYVRRKTSAANGFFENADVELNENILKVSLKKGGLDILKNQKIDEEIENAVLDMFGLSLKVELIETEAFDIEKAVKAAIAEKAAKEEEQKKEIAQNIKHELLGDLPIYIDTAKAVMGRPIHEKPRPISELSFDSGNVTVWGDIIKFEVKDTKRGVYKILTFDITDYTSSVTVKVFAEKAEVDRVAEKIQQAKTLMVKGNYRDDKFTSEYMITPDKTVRTI